MGDERGVIEDVEEMIRSMDKGIIEAVGMAGAITLAYLAIVTWFQAIGGWECAGENLTNVPSRS